MTEAIIRRIVVFLRNAKDWVIAQFFFAILGLLKLFPADGAIWFCAEAARGLGMRYPRTKLARDNLKRAFPEKSSEEIEKILSEMWANMGRLAAEYVYLDKIFHIDENDQSKGRVEITGEENFYHLRDLDGPAICFTGHTGNWEILPIASAAYGVNITALFRPPNNRYMAKKVLAARTTAMGHLVPSKAGASWALANVMDENGKVGMLVDQFFGRGTEISFFDQQTMANPLLAKLGRQYDCPVFPARCIRLPNGRFRIDIEPALELPRLADGRLDTDQLTQDINACIERWVREYPEQWLWLHKRWRPNFMAKRAEQLKNKKKAAR
ncbi:MAG: lipid A biosynthesis lauroyl acyltransferase [Pseudomonadota bacterium]